MSNYDYEIMCQKGSGLGMYVCATDTSYIVQQKVHHSSNSVVENCLKWLVMEIAFIVEYLINYLEHKKSIPQYVVWYPTWNI